MRWSDKSGGVVAQATMAPGGIPYGYRALLRRARYLNMVVIRPVAEADLDGLLELAGLAGVGLSTLPKDRSLLAKRVRKSIDSFETQTDRPGGEAYLLVMEDCDTRRVVGACGIVSKVGGF